MRIGLYLSRNPPQSLDTIVRRAQDAERRGLDTLWFSQLYDYDALTLIALVGRETSRIELGTWVVPTYPRHPTALAQQALTTQAACGNRLLLAMGLSHKVVIEKRFGLDFSKPVRHMREYLEVLIPLLEGQDVRYRGEEFRVRLQLGVPSARRPSVLVAALGPQMLRLTGRLADGATIWLGGPRYLEELAIPTLREAAKRAGRREPRIAVGLPIAVVPSEAEGRAAIAKMIANSSALPSYQFVLQRQGAERPEDVGITGDESAVRDQLEHLSRIGVTDFHAIIAPVDPEGKSQERTAAFLAEFAS